MKKLVFSFFALMACFVLASCGSNPTSTLESITKEYQNADEISYEDAIDMEIKALNAQIDFYSDLDRSEKDIEAFETALKDYDKASSKYSDKVEKEKKEEIKDLQKKLGDVRSKFIEKQSEKKKNKKDED